jgi:hypothetical protein
MLIGRRGQHELHIFAVHRQIAEHRKRALEGDGRLRKPHAAAVFRRPVDERTHPKTRRGSMVEIPGT